MDKAALLRLAEQYFVSDVGLNTANLVRKIQLAKGHLDCFATGKTSCDESDCRWRKDCLGQDGQADVVRRKTS
jgi:hypothetical protein